MSIIIDKSQEYKQILLSLLRCRVLYYDVDQLLEIIDDFYNKNKDFISEDAFEQAKHTILANYNSYITDNTQLVYYIHDNYPNINQDEFSKLLCNMISSAFNDNLIQSIEDVGDVELFNKMYNDIATSIFYSLITSVIVSKGLSGLPNNEVPQSLMESIFNFLYGDVNNTIDRYRFDDFTYHINSYFKEYVPSNYDLTNLNGTYQLTFNLIKIKDSLIEKCYQSVKDKYDNSQSESVADKIYEDIKNEYNSNPDLQLPEVINIIKTDFENYDIVTDEDKLSVLESIKDKVNNDPDADETLKNLINEAVDEIEKEIENPPIYNSPSGQVSTNTTVVGSIPNNVDPNNPTYVIPVTQSQSEQIVQQPTTLTISNINGNNTATVDVDPSTTVSDLVDQMNQQLPDDSQVVYDPNSNSIIFPNTGEIPAQPTVSTSDDVPVNLNNPIYTELTTDSNTNNVDDVPSSITTETTVIFPDPNNINPNSDPGTISIIVDGNVISIPINPGESLSDLIQNISGQLPDNVEIIPNENGFTIVIITPTSETPQNPDVSTDGIPEPTVIPQPPTPNTVNNTVATGTTQIDPTTPVTSDGSPTTVINEITIVNQILNNQYTYTYNITTTNVSNLQELINNLQNEINQLNIKVNFILDELGNLTVTSPNGSVTQVTIDPQSGDDENPVTVDPITVDTQPSNSTTNTSNTNPYIDDPNTSSDTSVNNPENPDYNPQANDDLINNTNPQPGNNPETTDSGVNTQPVPTDTVTNPEQPQEPQQTDEDIDDNVPEEPTVPTTDSGLPIQDTDDIPTDLPGNQPADIPTDDNGNPVIIPGPEEAPVNPTGEPDIPNIDIPDLPGDPNAIDQDNITNPVTNDPFPTDSDVGSTDTTGGPTNPLYPNGNTTVYDHNHSKNIIDRINDITRSIYEQNAAWAQLLNGNPCSIISRFLPKYFICSGGRIIFAPFGTIDYGLLLTDLIMRYINKLREKLFQWYQKIQDLIRKFLSPFTKLANFLAALLNAIAALVNAIASPKAICAFLKNPGKLFQILFQKPGVYISFQFNLDQIIEALKNLIKTLMQMLIGILKMIKDQILMMINTIKNAIMAIYKAIRKAMGTDICDLIVGLAMALGLLPKVFRALKVLLTGAR